MTQENHRADVDAAFARAVADSALDLPLPGGGATRQRWSALSDLAEQDLALVRLAEGHTDALAILAELDQPVPRQDGRWGVWAADPPGPRLAATASSTGWRLRGRKRYCSGARICTHALVTAHADDGRRLFRVGLDQPGLRPDPESWRAVGMAASDTLDVDFDEVSAVAVGEPEAYVERPGFWHGGIGVAACWHGGARGVAKALLQAARERDIDPHALAHLGEIDVALTAVATALDAAAAEIDADPADSTGGARQRAIRLRAQAATASELTITATGRALGAGPLCHDAAHARRVADLAVYIRQHHAERDFAQVGQVAAERGVRW